MTNLKKKSERLKLISEMLNQIDEPTQKKLLDNLKDKDPKVTKAIRNMMFVFDDLVKINDRDIQTIIQGISREHLKSALKTANDTLKNLIFKNMPSKLADDIKNDILTMGLIKKSDVEASRMVILDYAKKLIDEGKITLKTSERLV